MSLCLLNLINHLNFFCLLSFFLSLQINFPILLQQWNRLKDCPFIVDLSFCLAFTIDFLSCINIVILCILPSLVMIILENHLLLHVLIKEHNSFWALTVSFSPQNWIFLALLVSTVACNGLLNIELWHNLRLALNVESQILPFLSIE